MVQQLQTAACVLIVLFATIGTTAVALRLWARYITKKWGLDDSIVLFAWLLAAGETFCVYQYTLLSYQGYHERDIPKQTIDEKVLAQQYNIANQVLYNPILSLIKLSVIVFYQRLEDRRRIVQWNIYALAAFEMAFMIASTLVDIFQCTPVQYSWEAARMDLAAQQAAGADENGQVNGVTIKGGHCIKQGKFFLSTNGIAIFTDIWVLVIPGLILWDLRMPKRTKIAAFSIIGAGGIVAVVGIIRLTIYSWRFNPNNHDMSWGVGYTTSGMVVHVAFVAACAPTLKAIFTRFWPKLFASSRNYIYRNRDYKGYGYNSNANNNGSGVGGITVTNSIHVSEARSHEMRGISQQKRATESEEEIMSYGAT
ncbi:hypothetical protein PISL3812_06067 [Talaromyces islandicus]|uniref:Rhodopsin domain-containing protein n=1 Tax=Talaromyces islandicus TaxID=28573 RepID=A0A0U1M0U2_TALIS|nr:hypothetical protein PISL3812_06067 [Talaromyces islandicus]